MKSEVVKSPEKKESVWNKNFFLLWQGQLVSVLGDALYMVALDLWVFDMTGSTALMGILSAVTMLPHVIMLPFGGVFADKLKKTKVLVLTDLIRGIVITFVGIAGVLGFIQVWMVFIVGAVTGLCSAFFGPAAGALKPELVPESQLVRANSLTGMADSGMNILGNAVGGMIYIAIGASYMFLFNGISYLISAFTEIFIKEPEYSKKETKKISFLDDLKTGFNFVWRFKTLRNIFITAAAMNMLFCAGFIVMPAFFKSTEYLGAEKYGVFLAVFSVGQLLGNVALSMVTLTNENRYKVYAVSCIASGVLYVVAFLFNNFYLIAGCVMIACICNAVFNIIANSTMVLVVPREHRGKVGSLMNTMSMGLQPVGTLIGGILGEFIPYKLLIVGLFAACMGLYLFVTLPKGIKTLISYSKEKGSIEELIEKTNKGMAM